MFETIAEITIDRPIEEVFAFIADNENDPQWCVPVVETTRISSDSPSVGARYSFASQVGLTKVRGEFETTVFVPPATLEWVGESFIVKFSGQYRLVSEAEGTRLEERATFEPKGLFVFLQAVMIPQYKKTYDTQLRRLKRLLEDGKS